MEWRNLLTQPADTFINLRKLDIDRTNSTELTKECYGCLAVLCNFPLILDSAIQDCFNKNLQGKEAYQYIHDSLDISTSHTSYSFD